MKSRMARLEEEIEELQACPFWGVCYIAHDYLRWIPMQLQQQQQQQQQQHQQPNPTTRARDPATHHEAHGNAHLQGEQQGGPGLQVQNTSASQLGIFSTERDDELTVLNLNLKSTTSQMQAERAAVDEFMLSSRR